MVQSAAPTIRSVALRSTLWVLLGSWFGAWVVFAFVVAPTAFRVLPSTAVAGTVISPVLGALHLYGGFAGIALALLAWALGRGRILAVLPLGLGAICLFSHFGVTAEIAEVRELAFGPEGSVESAARFTALHQRSMGLFPVVGLAVLALIVLHSRADAAAISSQG